MEHVRGPGCYGHSGVDDAALDAALLARAVPDGPSSCGGGREDEHTWEPFGPAGVAEIQGESLDAHGNVESCGTTTSGARRTSFGRRRARTPGRDCSHCRTRWAARLSAPPEPMTGFHVGIDRNADPLYDLPHRRIVKHFVQTMPLRTSALRSLGAWFKRPRLSSR